MSSVLGIEIRSLPQLLEPARIEINVAYWRKTRLYPDTKTPVNDLQTWANKGLPHNSLNKSDHDV